jgi:hypothetical protein
MRLGCRAEAGLLDDLTDARIEALHHAIGLRVTWRNESVFDLGLLVQDVEHMLAVGIWLTSASFFLLVNGSVN